MAAGMLGCRSWGPPQGRSCWVLPTPSCEHTVAEGLGLEPLCPQDVGSELDNSRAGARRGLGDPARSYLSCPPLEPPPPRPGFGASRTIMEAEWVTDMGEQRVSPEGLIQ